MNDATGNNSIEDLRDKAYFAGMEERVALLREAVRLADSASDVALGMELRDELLHAASDAGYFEDELLAFNWMLAQADRDPQKWASAMRPLLWNYKWILEHLPDFPQVTTQQLDKAFQDMERRYTRAGHGLKAVHKLKAMAALRMGDLELAARQERLWHTAAPDSLSDCAACEVAVVVDFLVSTGRHEEAIAGAAKLLAGKLKCSEVPNTTFSRLLLPLLLTGRAEQAATCQRKGFAQMRGSRKFLGYLADHVTFLTLTGQETKAVSLLEARLPWVAETRNGFSRFRFFLAARLLLARIQAAGRQSLRLRLPETLACHRADDTYATKDLADWFLGAAREVAGQFDRRNGNDHFTNRLIPENERLVAMPTIPLPAKFHAGRDAA